MNKEMTTPYTMELTGLELSTPEDAAAAITAIDCTKPGVAIMKDKAVFHNIKVSNMDVRAANILKQTFLSKGGEVAVSGHCADFSAKTTDVIIMATLHQYKLAIPVLLIQPWGLKKLAVQLKAYLEL